MQEAIEEREAAFEEAAGVIEGGCPCPWLLSMFSNLFYNDSHSFKKFATCGSFLHVIAKWFCFPKICLQLSSTSKKSAKKVLNTVVKFINKEIGKYNEHPFLSDKYIWDTPEGNIILYRMSKFNIHSVNIFFTSNIIREQMLRLQEGT